MTWSGPSAAIRPASSRSRRAVQRAIRASASRCQRSRAAARPTARATATVPGLRPCCWPPPKRRGRSFDPPADQEQPDADRAVELVGAGRQGGDPQGRGSRPGCGRRPARRRCGPRRLAPAARAARRPTGWIAPVSLWARIRVARRVSGRSAAAIALGVDDPLRIDLGASRRRTRRPPAARPARRRPGAPGGWRPGGRGPAPAPARPKRARLFASVPPEVKTTSAGSAPRMRATVSRARSQARRAARPAACRLSGLPPASQCGRIASRTSGSSGDVALWSR